jgi:hypothetical protein
MEASLGDVIGKPITPLISSTALQSRCKTTAQRKAQPPLRAAETCQNAPELVRAVVGCSAGWAARPWILYTSLLFC